MQAYAVGEATMHVHDSGGVAKLLDMMDEFKEKPQVTTAVLEALPALTPPDKDKSAEYMALCVPKIFMMAPDDPVSACGCVCVWLERECGLFV